MLQEIYISNFILIDELRMEFSSGLNILSGETGAGKSIIIDALGLLMGDRVNSDFVRDEGRRALVEGVFDVSSNPDARIFLFAQGLADDSDDPEAIIISREIKPGGKTMGRINGRPVTAASLKLLSNYLLDMHLQNDRQNILRPVNYIDYVDSFTGCSEEFFQKIASAYNLLADKKKQLEDLSINVQNRLQRLDFLNYQIREIEGSGLYEGEEEELKQRRDRIRDAGRLLDGSLQLLELLYNSNEATSAYDRTARALDIVVDLKKDSFFADMLEPMEQVYYSLQEMADRISEFKARLEFEPGEMEEVENRLYLISKLQNKYGKNIGDILTHLHEACAERKTLEESEGEQDKLEAEIAQLNTQYLQLANELSQKRSQAAKILERKVHQEMIALNMPDINFKVSVERKSTPGSRGFDHIDFLFSANPGEEMKSVARIASGGEISRFILALKTALAGVYRIPTLIFDEIDTGLGGSALNAVAQKLAELAANHQLILVTHAPQVASYGTRNFTVEKYIENEKTCTKIKALDAEEKVMEIARMLDGEKYSRLTLEHAREMINLAQKVDSRTDESL